MFQAPQTLARALLATALTTCLLLAGSQVAGAAYTATFEPCDIFRPSGQGLLARCQVTHASADLSISLHGTAPNNVTQIVLDRPGNRRPRQVLEVKLVPVIDPETVAIIYDDANFDGYKDIAVMQHLPAGPNVPYAFFLFDAVSNSFEPHDQLSEVTSPEILTSEKRLRSHWRSSARISGTDIFAWQDGELILIERKQDTIGQDGQCRRQVFTRSQAGKLVASSDQSCR